MAKFPIVRATGTLPGIAPAARADIDVRTGARALAQGIIGLGKDIEKFETMQASTELSEFKRKVREEHNRLAISYDGNLDPNTFKTEYEKSLAIREGLIPKNRFASKAAREWLNDRMPVWARGVEESRKARISDNFKAGGFELKTEAERTGDTSKYFQHLHIGGILDVYDKEEIAKLRQDTTDKAERSLINNLIRQGQTNLAFEAVKESQLDEGEKRSFENTIRIAQNARENITETTSAELVNTAIEDSYAQIIKGNTDIASMITAIQDEPAILNKDSDNAADKIVTFFSKWNSAKVASESSEDVYDELTRASESVERGTMSPAAFEELYVDKKEFLDKDDQRTIRSKDIVATKTMQNRAFTDAMSATLPTLVELTESDLGAIKLARQNAEIIKDIASVNLFNISIKKNQAERWNYGRFRKQLRTQIDQNPEWSQKQIFVAQEILTNQLDIPVDQLLKEFDDQNPNRAIMRTPPSIDFKDIWPDLSIDDKAKIWELTMRGATAEVILGEIPVAAEFGARPSGEQKGVGFLGILNLKGGGVATEYSVGVKLEANDGKETNIPSLVPTLTKKEIKTMVNDIIPNRKPVPPKILQKAVDHANKRVRAGKSIFFEEGE